MRGIKTFVLLLVLLFGPFISLGKYIEETSEKGANGDEAEVPVTEDREMEDEVEEEGEEEEEYDRDEDQGEDELEDRDAKVVVHIPEQSSEEPLQEEADDDEDDNPRDEFEEEEEEEEEVDNLQDDRMMDRDEGGMSLAGQMEEDVPDQTGFESFKRKVEEINKANEELQVEINKLKMEFDKALSSDSDNDEGRSAPIGFHGTFISDSQKNVAI